MGRHIILEGPDGGGKTRLAEALRRRFPSLVPAPKASTSIGGPVDNLLDWARNQIKYMDSSVTPLMYDRHPVISEPIYGSIVRGKPKPGFEPSPWLTTMRLNLYDRVFVIWCIPSLEQCMSAVDKERDMPGVVENIERIYNAYLYEMNRWGGPNMRYNLNLMHSKGVTADGLFEGAVEFADDYSSLVTRQIFGATGIGGIRVAG